MDAAGRADESRQARRDFVPQKLEMAPSAVGLDAVGSREQGRERRCGGQEGTEHGLGVRGARHNTAWFAQWLRNHQSEDSAVSLTPMRLGRTFAPVTGCSIAQETTL